MFSYTLRSAAAQVHPGHREARPPPHLSSQGVIRCALIRSRNNCLRSQLLSSRPALHQSHREYSAPCRLDGVLVIPERRKREYLCRQCPNRSISLRGAGQSPKTLGRYAWTMAVRRPSRYRSHSNASMIFSFRAMIARDMTRMNRRCPVARDRP